MIELTCNHLFNAEVGNSGAPSSPQWPWCSEEKYTGNSLDCSRLAFYRMMFHLALLFECTEDIDTKRLCMKELYSEFLSEGFFGVQFKHEVKDSPNGVNLKH